jgi:hypothetical protein
MERSDFLESMDACRATSDDLRLPELAPLADRLATDPAARKVFDRIQRFDRRLSEATRDVPVPVGLAERIMACLESNSVEPGVVERAIDLEHDGDSATSATHVAPVRRRMGRRSWLLAATAASVLVAAAFTFWPRPAELTAQRLLENSGDWARKLWNVPAKWTSLPAGQRELAGFPMPQVINALASRWADVGDDVEWRAVAYDVSPRGGPRAMLLVIKDGEIDEGGPSPTASPQSTTGGLMIGCWQGQGVVYVLVVEGDERSYKNLLKAAPMRPFA